jgi:protein O-mannosyl-transferase
MCLRYELEFAFPLVWLAVMGIFGLEHALAARPAWRGVVRGCWGLLLAGSVAFNLFAGLGFPAQAESGFGVALLQSDRLDEAILHFQKAVALQPGSAKAEEGLGMALFRKGEVDGAMVHFQQALRIQPDLAEANNNLGAALIQKGQVNEAIACYRKAVQLAPLNAEFQNNLGYALFLEGDMREAVAHYQKSLEIRPKNAITCKNLAWILATCPEATVRNGAQAVALAERAVLLSGGSDPLFIGTLAAAYAEAGQFPEAVKTAQHAQQLAATQNNRLLVNALQAQIRLYQAGTPFREAGQTDASPPLR